MEAHAIASLYSVKPMEISGADSNQTREPICRIVITSTSQLDRTIAVESVGGDLHPERRTYYVATMH